MVAVTCPAHAHTTIVPDEFPTIQAALDHLGIATAAETVLVRPGVYPEVIDVLWEPAIVGMGLVPGGEPLVRVKGLYACYTGGVPAGVADVVHGGQRYSGLRFTGQVVICNTNGPVDIGFQHCQFDAGVASNDLFSYPDLSEISLWNCEVFGAASLRAQLLFADSSTFHGPLWLNAGYDAFVRDNQFEDIPGTAVTVLARDAHITGNLIRGGSAGINARTEDGDVHVENNRVEGCAGDGILADGNYDNKAYADRNVVSHVGGAGIRLLGLGAARGNRVIGCRGIGLDLQHYGAAAAVEGNVVGRCGSHGIMVAHDIYGDPGAISIQRNTVYACGGTALMLQDWAEGSLVRNIACLNVGPGLDMIRAVGEWPSGCNDWFGNGDTVTPANATDRRVDPLFCDLAADDVQLRSDSPLLDAPGCGQIGALGKGCDPPPVVIELELKQDVLPSAAHGGWVTAWLEPHAPFAASDVDISSVRLNGVQAASDGLIGDRDRDGIPDLRLRFDREALGQTLGRGAVATVIVTGSMRGRRLIGTDAVRIPPGQWFHRPSDLDPEASAPVLTIGAPMTIGIAGRLRVAFTLADASPARLEVMDVAGRVVLSRDVEGAGPGEHTMELGDRGRLAQGIYFLRLRQGGGEARTRAAIIR